MSAEGLERQPTRRDPEQESGAHMLDMFPWGDAGLHEYAKARKETPENIAAMKEVIYTFLDQEVQNTRIFESPGASFPYTVIRVADLARALYRASSGEVASTNMPEGALPKKHIEFVMTSALLTIHGHPFTFCEEAMHQTMRALPTALEALENGEEPEDIEVYTLGFPTNELGSMEEDFTNAMVEAPFKTLGSLYGESVETLALKNLNPDQQTELVFSGVSMGANFAAEAAVMLLDKGLVTQSREETKKPHLTLNLYTPAGMNESMFRTPQIGLGFAAEGIVQMSSNPVVKEIAPNEGKFLEKLKPVLQKQGMYPHMDHEQVKRKNKVTSFTGSIVKKLVQGVPVRPDLIANKIVGMKDPTLYSMKRNRALAEQNEDHSDSLGAHSIRESNPNQRTFGVEMSHTIPFFRESEFKRWDRVVEKLQALKKN